MRPIRITPAYAGQMKAYHHIVCHNRDHPRIRGTNGTIIGNLLLAWGSPPHTRDKSFCLHIATRQSRITPAYAGQIYFLVYYSCVFRDHPRIRGTNSLSSHTTPAQAGSPPHTRDKSFNESVIIVHIRITPAYAGQMELWERGNAPD